MYEIWSRNPREWSLHSQYSTSIDSPKTKQSPYKAERIMIPPASRPVKSLKREWRAGRCYRIGKRARVSRTGLPRSPLLTDYA
jgi:hypothetical protein